MCYPKLNMVHLLYIENSISMLRVSARITDVTLKRKGVTLKALKKPTVDSRFLLQHKCCQIIDSRHIVSSVLQISEALKGNEVCID